MVSSGVFTYFKSLKYTSAYGQSIFITIKRIGEGPNLNKSDINLIISNQRKHFYTVSKESGINLVSPGLFTYFKSLNYTSAYGQYVFITIKRIGEGPNLHKFNINPIHLINLTFSIQLARNQLWIWFPQVFSPTFKA